LRQRSRAVAEMAGLCFNQSDCVPSRPCFV
jgi:hypothetical protein